MAILTFNASCFNRSLLVTTETQILFCVCKKLIPERRVRLQQPVFVKSARTPRTYHDTTSPRTIRGQAMG